MTAALGGVSVQGCGDDGPADVQLTDASEGCGASPERLEQPIALGARLAIRLSVDGDDALAVTGVTSSDPAVIRVVEVANPLVVEALGVGSSQVDVRALRGVRASALLSVAEVATGTIRPDPLTLYNLDVNLQTPHPGAAELVLARGVVLLPGGELRLEVGLRDALGRVLIGHGAAKWASSEPGLSMTHLNALSDDVALSHQGLSAVARVTTAGGGRYEVPLAASVDAPSLAVWLPSQGAFVEALALNRGEARTLVLVARDEDERLVIDAGGLSAVSDAPDVVNVVAPPWAEPAGEIPLDDESAALLHRARVVFVQGGGPGHATLTLSTLGQQVALDVTVVE